MISGAGGSELRAARSMSAPRGQDGQASPVGASRWCWRLLTPSGSPAVCFRRHHHQRRCAWRSPLASPLMAADLTRPFAISSDGTRVVYVGRDSGGSSLYVQDLASGEIKRLSETGDADAPAFSPDGRAVGFRAGSAIKVVPVDGGLPREIARVERSQIHWAWSGPEHVILTGRGGVSRVAVNGGSPEVVVKTAGDEAIFSSAFELPGGAYLVGVRATLATDDASRVAVVIPGESKRLVVADRGSSPIFVAGDQPGLGHIVYAQAGRLIALPFDAAKRVVKGGAIPIVENVAMRPNGDMANYAVSHGGLSSSVKVRSTSSSRSIAPAGRFVRCRRICAGSQCRVCRPTVSVWRWRFRIRRTKSGCSTSSAMSWRRSRTNQPAATISRGRRTGPPSCIRSGRRVRLNSDGCGPTDHRLPKESLSPPTGGCSSMAGAAKGVSPRWSRASAEAAVMTLRARERNTAQGCRRRPSAIAEGVPGSFSPDGSWLSYCDCGTSGDRPANVFIQHLAMARSHQVSIDGGTEPVWAPSGSELFFRPGRR